MSTGVTIAVVGAPDFAKDLAKKGSASDLTLFNTVRDGHATTLVEPTQFPEKLPPLVTALAMADQCLLVITELTKAVAETIATLELVSVPTTVILGPSVGEPEVARLLKGGRLESAPRKPLDLVHLRELIESWTAPEVPGPVRVPIDHIFPVKGVGTVALGVVRQGTLHAHDRLRLWPSPKEVEVRSIQVHDIDRKEASCGERVGLALKGVEADEVSRGETLAPAGTLSEGSRLQTGPLEKCRYYRGSVAHGGQFQLAVDLQVVPAILELVGPSGGVVVPDRPVVYRPKTPALLLDLSAPTGPRVVGRLELLGPA
ncbi:MAG: EF-Tu/IF-2/RF-3 family GTPase [Thermoplasmata archaeon]